MQQALFDYLIALRNVVRQYRRSLFSLFAVAFGVVALLVTAGFIEWIFWATREGTIQAGLGHIHVTPAPSPSAGARDAATLPERSAELTSIESTPGVRTVAPRLAFSGLLSREEATLSFLGEGVSPTHESIASPRLIITAGTNLSADDPNGIVLGQGLASNLGAKVGDTVVLLANKPSGGINAVEGRVRGLFVTISKAYDDSALRTPIELARRLTRIEGAHRWVIVLDDTARAESVADALSERFAASQLTFVPWSRLADFYTKTVSLLERQVAVVNLIIAVIIVLSISNTMMMTIMERTAEIGTAMAMGTRRTGVLRQFLFEGLTVGLIGGAIGLVAGGALSTLISAVGIPMPPAPGMTQSYRGEILLTGRIAFDALALAVIAALIASLYPAWKASRMQIVDALRVGR